MKTSIRSDRIVTPQGVVNGYITLEDGKILSVGEEQPCDQSYDFTGMIVSPGFIETHAHGGGGADFLSGERDQVLRGCDFHLRHGTTSICPTVSAAAFPTMKQALLAIEAAMESGESRANILGAHLEGPYLSPAQCGAQSPASITAPMPEDYEPLLRDHGHAIARWSYAPERDDGTFVRTLTAHGILASAGHTDAIYDDMARAIDGGLSLITHLYSCTSTVTRDHGFRRLGVIETAFLRDELTVELIADGKHLPLDLMRMILKIKGVERTVLTSDCLSLTGTQETEGVMNGVEYVLEDGVCKLRDRTAFAGSIATAPVLLKTALEVGVSLTDAVNMMSRNPARLLGLNKGELTAGYDADVTVLSDDLTVKAVFVGGEQVI